MLPRTPKESCLAAKKPFANTVAKEPAASAGNLAMDSVQFSWILRCLNISRRILKKRCRLTGLSWPFFVSFLFIHSGSFS